MSSPTCLFPAQGSPSLTSSTTVDVIVQRVSNHAPKFTELFYSTVYENSPIGTVVLRVTSTDADVADVTRYSLTTSAGGLFTIDPDTGLITVAGHIDRETNSTFNLRVAANDGTFNIETSVTVDVLDENDEVPDCRQSSYSFNVVETSNTSTPFIGSIVGRDRDVTLPNNVTFFRKRNLGRDLVIGNDGPRGSVSWRVGASFEWIGSSPTARKPSPLNTKYAVVSVSDRGEPALSSLCSVSVTVLAENEYQPTFSRSSYRVVVPTSARSGFPIMTLRAS